MLSRLRESKTRLYFEQAAHASIREPERLLFISSLRSDRGVEAHSQPTRPQNEEFLCRMSGRMNE